MPKRDESPLAAKSFKGRIVLPVLFTIVVFLLFLIALEIVLRTTHLFGARMSWVTNDPVLGWRMIPGRTYWFNQENDHPITGRINRYGWRDDDWPLQKPAGSFRIAVLGDSHVEAYQVESEQTSLKLCQGVLRRELGMTVEIMNFGRAGFSQTEELLVLQSDVVQFDPDMVLVFFFPENDIGDLARDTAVDLRRPFFLLSPGGELILDSGYGKTREYQIRALLDGLKSHSALISWLGERWNMVQAQRYEAARKSQEQVPPDSPATLPASASLCTKHPEEAYRRNYGLTRILIKAMADSCAQRHIRFMLVTLNTRAYDPKVEQELKAVDPTYDPICFENDLREYAETLGIDYLGLQSIFRQHYLEHGIPLLWGHWNYEGHRVVAEALANTLKPIILEMRGQ